MADAVDTARRTYDGADDVAILAGLLRRDDGALTEAHRRHGALVRRVAGRVLAGSADVDDLVQDVFFRLWLDPAAFEPGRGSLGTFLATVARRRAIDRVRADSARARREAHDGPMPVAGDRVAEAVEARDVGTAIRAAVELLPALEQAAIRLAYFADHSYRDVAALLGVPEGTVKSRIRAGLGRLRRTADVVALQVAS